MQKSRAHASRVAFFRWIVFVSITFLIPALTAGGETSWEKVAGPPGVDVTVIYKTNNIVYAGTDKLGVYRSIDNGLNWTAANHGIERVHIYDIIASGPNLLASAAASQCPSSLNVFKSTDNGATWTPTSGLAGKIAAQFALKGGVVWAAVFNPSGSGVYRSADNGDTWQEVPSIIENGDKILVSGNAIIVAEDNFIWRSTDDGNSWDVVEQFALTGIQGFARSGTRLFAVSGTGYETSDDNGANWNFTYFPGGVGSFGSDGTTVYMGSASKVYRSTDFGASWQDHSNGLGRGFVHAMFVDGDTILVGSPSDTAGIYRSTNRAVNWSPAAAGLPFGSNVRSLVSFGGSIFAGMDGDGIYRTIDRGATWTKVDAGNPLMAENRVIDLFATSNTIFAATANGIYRSTDSGVTFQQIHNGFPTNQRIQAYSVTLSGGNILVAATAIVSPSEGINGIWYSSDNGSNWHQATIPQTVNAVSAVASDGSSRTYAGVYTNSSFTTGLYISTNGGLSWVQNPALEIDIENLAVKGSNVLASTLFSPFYSTDFGELNWIFDPLPGSVPLGTGVDTYTIVGTSIYAGNEGMYRSTESGANWQPIREGFPTCPLPQVLASAADDNFLYAGTVGEGVWRKLIGTAPAARTAFDYDGDGRADISVFRPSNGAWYLQRSTAGFGAMSWGVATDKIVPADYDGDNKTDVAVYRPSEGNWYVLQSLTGTLSAQHFGISEDIPAPDDFDTDGRADVAVYRPSTGTWWINRTTGGLISAHFGISEDKPVAGDYDGDGRAELAVFRPSNGTWYYSSDFTDPSHNFVAIPFGLSTDLVTPADFDGDGRTDIAVYRASEGNWYLNRSTSGFLAVHFGVASDIPAAGDFDGDGNADITVFRPSDGTWYRLNSLNGGFNAFQFGTSGDRPTPSAFRY